MAEFCLDCWNNLNETNDSKKKYILSKDYDLCECCGQWKSVIIMERKSYFIHKLKYLIFLLRITF